MDSASWFAAAQAVAYMVLAIVAVFTYVQARKTVFMPLRTKLFDVQLAALQDIMANLIAKDEVELRRCFGLNDLLRANAVRLYDQFLRDVYGIATDESQRPYASHLCDHSVVHEKIMLPRTEEAGEHFFRNQHLFVVVPRAPDSARARDWWREFEALELVIPNSMAAAEDQLLRAASSPLLPSQVASAIEGLIGTIHSNRELLLQVITIAGRELPQLYPGEEPPSKFDTIRVSDLYNAQVRPLKPRADAVVVSIRAYWRTLGLIE